MATEKKNQNKKSTASGRKSSNRRKKKNSAAQEITGYGLIVLGIFSFAAVLLGSVGLLGEGLAKGLFGLFGMGAYIVPLILAGVGWILLIAKKLNVHKGKLALTTVTVLMIFVVNHMIFDGSIQAMALEGKESAGYWEYIAASYGYGQAHHLSSGALGGILTYPMRALLGNVGCWILTLALIVGCIFALGKLSMRKTAQQVNDAALEKGRQIRDNARQMSSQRAQERRERQEQRRMEQTQTRLDLEAAGEMPMHDHRQVLRNEHVTGPAVNAEEPIYSPLTHEEPEEVEVGEIYEAPRKKLFRFDVLKKQEDEPEQEDVIEIDHVAAEPMDTEEALAEVFEEMKAETPQPTEDEYVPLEVVPVIRPAAEKKAEETPRSAPTPKKLTSEFKNPSISDFDDDPAEEEDDGVIEPPMDEPTIRVARPAEISPATEVEYQYGEETTPIIDPTAIPPYRFPPMTLLSPAKAVDPVKDHEQEEEQQRKVELLEETLLSFGIEAHVINVARGPAITRYELQPARGVKVSKITGLADDIALNMAAAGGVRIEAPVPGKSAVGIEIANSSIATVTLREVLESQEFQSHASKLAVALGKDIAGTPVIADLARMPHLLIAGATGSGKSVCINSVIASILYKATPDEVKLILIDPKVVELSVYNGIPHLLIPVVTDPKKAAGALGWAVQEMTDRYKKFEGASVRDLKGYNKHAIKTGMEPLPQIVVIIDELADLMMVAQNDVETKICRLTQLARAAGIHLVIATQRPSVDVITGLIKANVPSRIAFAVASQVDSRTILGIGGAEKLLGRGDMLFDPSGASKAIRVQGAFINDDEVTDLVDFVKEKTSVQYDQSVIDMLERADADGKKQKDEDKSDEDVDPLLWDCVELAIDAGQVSASMIQRKYRVGYARAGRILDQMEQKGCISGFEGSKPRQTLITREQYYEMAGIEPDTLIYEDSEE